MMIIEAPAKINLFLSVIRKRDDGYHELRSLMCCVGLYDTVVLDFNARGNSIRCEGADLPCDESNLALKAAGVFHRRLAETRFMAPTGVAINLNKRIPVGAGLGGGSSDAAAVLRGMNRRYGRPFDSRQLKDMALSLGADVPFFVDRTPALAAGVGELLTPVGDLPPLDVLLVYPGFSIATVEVFKKLNLALTKCQKHLRYFPFKNGTDCIVRCLCNDLETVVIERFPIIDDIKKQLLIQGAMGALMSGSGSTVFGLFPDGKTARAAEKKLERLNRNWRMWSTTLVGDKGEGIVR